MPSSADEQRIVPQAISDLGMKFVQAPVIDGGTMFQVLQRPGMPGVIVSAFDLEEERGRLADLARRAVGGRADAGFRFRASSPR